MAVAVTIASSFFRIWIAFSPCSVIGILMKTSWSIFSRIEYASANIPSASSETIWIWRDRSAPIKDRMSLKWLKKSTFPYCLIMEGLLVIPLIGKIARHFSISEISIVSSKNSIYLLCPPTPFILRMSLLLWYRKSVRKTELTEIRYSTYWSRE